MLHRTKQIVQTDLLLRPKGSNISYFSNPEFAEINKGKIFHGFFCREGGSSIGEYKSLNCGQGSGDLPDFIKRNRQAVADIACIDGNNLLSVYQVHHNKCINVTHPWTAEERPQADAMVTTQPGFGLGILVADCAPILFQSAALNGSPIVGAAHAGWKGALSGVIENTIIKMKELGAVDKIKAIIGPCIGKEAYEVSKGFELPFYKENIESEAFFSKGNDKDHLRFDLRGYCKYRLHRAGVKHASAIEKDTFSDESNFFSYRRSTHRKEKDYGRQIAVIAIRPPDFSE